MTRTFIIVNYQVNKDYVAKVLCENKEDKELKCEGKCHLKKQLEKEEKKESTPTGNSKEKFETNLYNTPVSQSLLFQDQVTLHTFFYLEKEGIQLPSAVFHPPALLG